MDNLLKSRRFWILVLDSTISIVLHYAGGQDTTFLISVLQPIFLAVITAYTIEGTARIKAGK